MEQVHIAPTSNKLAGHRTAGSYRNYGERLYVEGRLDAMRREQEVGDEGPGVHRQPGLAGPAGLAVGCVNASSAGFGLAGRLRSSQQPAGTASSSMMCPQQQGLSLPPGARRRSG